MFVFALRFFAQVVTRSMYEHSVLTWRRAQSSCCRAKYDMQRLTRHCGGTHDLTRDQITASKSGTPIFLQCWPTIGKIIPKCIGFQLFPWPILTNWGINMLGQVKWLEFFLLPRCGTRKKPRCLLKWRKVIWLQVSFFRIPNAIGFGTIQARKASCGLHSLLRFPKQSLQHSLR